MLTYRAEHFHALQVQGELQVAMMQEYLTVSDLHVLAKPLLCVYALVLCIQA